MCLGWTVEALGGTGKTISVLFSIKDLETSYLTFSAITGHFSSDFIESLLWVYIVTIMYLLQMAEINCGSRLEPNSPRELN